MGMLFKELKLQNFGPYYGEQLFLFGVKAPIVLVHGPNMTGKTSLLNAIRWVLYGHALNRFGKPMALKQLINHDAAESGNWIMAVELSFEVENIHYDLERRIQPKDPSITPRSDNDFEVKLFLQQNGRHLNTGEVQTEINRILPEQISRFFLFDGELLNEYETLLANPDRQALIIKESIEHILGVPALGNAISDLKVYLSEAERRQRTLASRDQKAHVYAAEAARLASIISTNEKDLSELQDHHEELQRRQVELDDRLQAIAGIEAEVERLQDFETRSRSLHEEQQRLLQENRDKLSDAWLDLLEPTLQQRLTTLEAESQKQIDNLQRVGQLRSDLDHIQHLLDMKECPVCGQSPTEAKYSEYLARKTQIEEELAGLAFDQEKLSHVSESLQKLRKIRSPHVIETIASNEKRLMRISVDLGDLAVKIDEINDHLKGHDKTEIARNRRDYIEVNKELGVLEQTIAEKERVIRDLQIQVSKNRANMSAVSGPEMQRSNREVQLCDDLISLYGGPLCQDTKTD